MIDGVLGTVFLDLIVVLLVARIGGWLAEKIGQPSVLGELLVGLILGPSLLGLINPFAEGENIKMVFEILTFLGEIGIMLLLFQVGLESNIYKLLKCGVTSLLVACIGVAVPVVAGFAFCFVFLKYSFAVSLFIGATLAATSVGITMRVLRDIRKINSEEGRIILGAAVIDDVIGLVLLSVMVDLVGTSAVTLSEVVIGAFIKTVVAVLFLATSIWAGIKFSPYIFKIVHKFKMNRTFVVSAFIFMLAYGYAANAIGLAAIVGAFAAGLIFERLEDKEHFEDRIKPVANIFVPVFFVMAGVYMDIYAFGDLSNIILIAVLLTIAVVGKIVAGIGAIRSKAYKLAVGIGMIPRGEVGLIFASYGLAGGLFNNDIYSILVTVIMLTTFVTPYFIVRSMKNVKPEGVKDKHAHVI